MADNFLIKTFIKDFKIALSFKGQFIFSIISIFSSVFFVYIFSNLFNGDNPVMDKYGGSYFVFLFVGIVSAEITLVFLNTMPSKVREYQLTGIFEELLVSGRRPEAIIFGTLLYPFVFQIFRYVIYLSLFIAVYPESHILNNFGFSSLIALILLIISLLGISFISTGFTVLFKNPSVINRVYLLATSILSGIAYPVELLPKFLILLGEIIPTTHFLKIVRFDLTAGNANADLVNTSIIVLLFMSLFFICIGIYVLNKAIRLSKLNGSLLSY